MLQNKIVEVDDTKVKLQVCDGMIVFTCNYPLSPPPQCNIIWAFNSLVSLENFVLTLNTFNQPGLMV